MGVAFPEVHTAHPRHAKLGGGGTVYVRDTELVANYCFVSSSQHVFKSCDDLKDLVLL